MTAIRTDTLANDFINNDLYSGIPHLTDGSLNNDEITVPVIENLDEPLKGDNGVSMMPVGVNLPVDATIESNDGKSVSNVFITVPVGSIVKYSMSYVCRLCGGVITADSMVNIFETNEFQENICYKINKYLPIVVYEGDPFPKTVCKLCVSKINQFHDLVEKCVSVEEHLRQNYVYDERYLEVLNKKRNIKPGSEIVKSDSVNNQLYELNEFQYVENIYENHVNTNEIVKEEETNDEKRVDIVKKVMICQYCEGDVINEKDCFDHFNRHYGDAHTNEFPCLLCSYIHESRDSLKTHIRSHFKTKSINSRDKTKARQQKLLKNKIKVCNKVLCCRKCKQSLDGIDAAIEHCVKHKPSNVKFYPCVLCVNGIGKTKLKEHISVHFPVLTKPILSCDNCNNLYPDEKTLKYHRCTKLRKFKCSQCKQGFKSEDRLKFHEDFHRNKSTFCEICKKDFKFESRIYLHFAGVHNGIRDKPYCCDVCGKTFTWLTLLNSHKRTHTNERPFKCTKCDARFCNKYSLNGHMPSHEDHPQMYCDKCDYHTGRKQNLLNHISRFHKEIDSSQVCIRCKICNEIFPNKHHIVVEDHSNRHSQSDIYSVAGYESDLFQELTVTKLYQCERCERCFSSVDHLTQHRSTHSSENFYQCRLCESGFPKHDLLVKHQKVHIQVTSQYDSKLSVLIVISCDICGVECIDYRQLLNHKDRANCMMKKITGTLRPRKVLIKKHLQPLKTHQLFVNSSGLFECPSCQRTYKNRRRYRLHLATHSNSSII